MFVFGLPGKARAARVATALIGALAIAGAAGSWTGVLAALGTFEASLEGEIWQQLIPPIGQALDPSCTHPTQHETVCGSSGSPPPLTEMNNPLGIAVDNSNGNMYVTDHDSARVLVFDSSGNPIQLPVPIGNGRTGGGQQLNLPEGIRIDAAHQIIVGDSFNGRVAVFAPDGLLEFELTDPALVNPTGVAITRGATLTNHGVPQNPANTNRFVVSDKYNCFVYVYDSDFYPIATIGSGNCATTDGDVSGPEGVAIDTAGHIFVADYDNSRIDIYSSTGGYLGKFGQPGSPAGSVLQNPTDLLISAGSAHPGRAVVMDSVNQRLAFYDISFAATPPTASFKYAISAQGGLSFPSGIAEDTSHDPVGKLLVTDTGMNRIQQFQQPDLAVVQVNVNPSTNTGVFGVVVPLGKNQVVGVIPTVVGTNATAVLVPLPTPVTILPGQIANYTFSYNATGAPVSFTITATGNCDSSGCHTTSNSATAVAAVPCTGCSSSAAITSPAGPPPASGWYTSPVTVTITATSSTALHAINYIFSGAEGGAQPGLRTFSTGATTASVNVTFDQEKSSAVEYWAVNSDFTEELPHHVLPVKLDLFPPVVEFQFSNASLPANADGWWKGPVSVPFVFSDDVSGATLATGSPTSPLVFNAQGANQSRTITVVDGAGHSVTAASNDPLYSGQPVNIDSVPPTLTVPAPVTLVVASPSGSTLPANTTFKATAIDALSGVKSITNPIPGPGGTVFPLGVTTWTFVATDKAGNQATGTSTVTVKVETAPPTISVTVTPSVLWPPDHRLVTITAHVTTSDPSGLPVTVKLVSITSSEPDAGLGEDDLPHDIQGATFGTDDRVFQLRAERSRKGPGRTYTITYSATGPTGVVATAVARVVVPHDMGGDDGDKAKGDEGKKGDDGDKAKGDEGKKGDTGDKAKGDEAKKGDDGKSKKEKGGG